MKIKLIILSIIIFILLFILLLTSIVAIYYFNDLYQDIRDKQELETLFNSEIPVYSETNLCSSFKFWPRNTITPNWAEVLCEYIPQYNFNETMIRYDSELIKKSWILTRTLQNNEEFHYAKESKLLRIIIPARIRSSTIYENGTIVENIDKDRSDIIVILSKIPYSK